MLIDRLVSALGIARRDLVYALRRAVKTPGFTAVGVVSLAIGIGLCSLVFAQLSALLLRPLPGVADPTGLVSVQRPVPYPFVEAYRDEAAVAAGAAAFIGPVPFGVAVDEAAGDTARVFGHLVSPEYFATLGVVPQRGRVFAPDTERPGAPPVAVVSERFWLTRLDADPAAVGRTLRINGQPVTIVGIGPPEFRGVYPINPADLFLPVTAGPAIAPELGHDALNDRTTDRFRVVLRLAAGVTPSAAEAALDVVTRNLRAASGADPERERAGRETRLLSAEGMSPISDEQRTLTLGSNLILLGMVLTLVCGNLATLLLARASERRREVALRLALGASRPGLVRQLLTESVVIALAGGAAGVLVAYWLVGLVESLAPAGGAPVDMRLSVDLPVLAFTFAVAVSAGVGFGLMPAISTARAEIAGALKGSDLAPLRRYRRFGVRNLLVVYQVAGALTLLLVTGWVVLGYQRSASVDPGFDTARLYLLTVDPPRDGLAMERASTLFTHLQDRLPLIAGVERLTLAASPPFASLMVTPNFRVSVPSPGDDTSEQHTILRRQVGAGYFSALGIPIVRGRELETRDQGEADVAGPREIPVVLNQAAAGRLFPGAGAIDGRIRAGGDLFGAVNLDLVNPTAGPAASADDVYRVVGVSQDVKSAFMNAEAVPTMFWPITAEGFARSSAEGTTMVVRGAPAIDVVAAVRDDLAVTFPELTVFNVRTMDEHVNQFNTLVLWSSVINGGIGVFALILAAIGLAGVTTHAVARRRKEIGIRIALGAGAPQVLRLVLTESLTLVVVGGVLGFAGAAALARAFAAFTAEFARIMAMGTGDPVLLVGAPVLLLALTLLACVLPARHSTRVDPLTALREQ